MVVPTRKIRILVVDDEAGFTALLKLNLEQTGAYEVREEHRAGRALAAARAFRPDLILLDVIMPEMDGTELAARLAADADLKDTPVVFLTAAVSHEEAGQRSGLFRGHPCLAKPVGHDEVIACITRHLRRAPGD